MAPSNTGCLQQRTNRNIPCPSELLHWPQKIVQFLSSLISLSLSQSAGHIPLPSCTLPHTCSPSEPYMELSVALGIVQKFLLVPSPRPQAPIPSVAGEIPEVPEGKKAQVCINQSACLCFPASPHNITQAVRCL